MATERFPKNHNRKWRRQLASKDHISTTPFSHDVTVRGNLFVRLRNSRNYSQKLRGACDGILGFTFRFRWSLLARRSRREGGEGQTGKTSGRNFASALNVCVCAPVCLLACFCVCL